MAKKSTSDETPHFEQAVAELEQIVRRLEQGGNSLSDDLSDYGKAIRLIKQCHARLAEGERTVQLLIGVDSDGNPITGDYDAAASGDDDSTLEKKQADRTRRRSAQRDDTQQDDSLF